MRNPQIWEKLTSCTDFKCLLRGCTNLRVVQGMDISNWTSSTYVGNAIWFIFEDCKNLATIDTLDVSFTQYYSGNQLTNDFWIGRYWRWFDGWNNLSSITFSGTVYSGDDFGDYRIFQSCDTTKLSYETWQSFDSIFPEANVAKQIVVGKNQACLDAVPSDIVVSLTNKGYSLIYKA